jgi:hypothetical protein
MATVQIIYWLDIPSAVEVSDAGCIVRRPLSVRYQGLIERVAAERGIKLTGDHSAQLRTGTAAEEPGDAYTVVLNIVEELERRFPEFERQAIRPRRV